MQSKKAITVFLETMVLLRELSWRFQIELLRCTQDDKVNNSRADLYFLTSDQNAIENNYTFTFSITTRRFTYEIKITY